MQLPNLKNEVIQYAHAYMNGNKGNLSMWSGTMPTFAELVAQDSSLAWDTDLGKINSALRALGCLEMHRTSFNSIRIDLLDENTIEYDCTSGVSGQVNYIQGTPTFATFLVNNRTDWWHSASSVPIVYMGTVGLVGSGADLEFNELTLDANSEIKIGKFAHSLV